MEGAHRQRQKAYNADFGEGTAVVLRLAQPYAGSGRTVVADSAFSSVKTLVQLNSMMGLYFMGMVKTATKEYPMDHLKVGLVFRALVHETKSNNIVACSTVAFGEFASRLAHQLIFNDYLTGRVRRDGNADGDMDDVSVPVHSLLALGDRPRYKRLKKTPQRAQRRCKICKKKASFYCATCSDCNEESYFALCRTMTGRTCYHQHLEASQAR
ncbi:hypothetical protein PPTG_24270 [Phytophthora nicotianae INRA-310]|uniref:PiggyBac transposable element-derived protein domain-containing protein n=1 Tax=Phytophthora nicotianae (strain INRA-310) TaxID=761204 RepID=W2PJM1_PHYN3|nr:hypothetical protein PPTG_24270 [Phytophthora nicotianae INRA-310]ETN00434.1 hypothetical protein PPTG_24270 [Phytophthora nicotianae INRA-310]